MCGIVAISNLTEPVEQARDKALKMAAKVRHRGPDWSGIYCDSKAVLAHERLSVVDVEKPFEAWRAHLFRIIVQPPQ